MNCRLNKDQPVELERDYLPWQIIDKDRKLVCEFRGPQSMMCCMAALQAMNNPEYSMEKAMDIYRIEKG